LPEIVSNDFPVFHAHDVQQFIENVSRNTSTPAILKSGKRISSQTKSPHALKRDG